MTTFIFLVIFSIVTLVYLYRNRDKNRSQNFSQTSQDITSLDKTIGETRAICPYCKQNLKKKPSRKKKCPHCGKYIYKRTRPYDDAHIIIREDQIEDLEEQWAIANGEHELFLKEKNRKEKIKDRLTDQDGNEPTKEDVEFRALNKKATECELEGNWGFARNMRLKMAKNLEKRESYRLALRKYCHVCFLDINGPNNRRGTSKELLKEFPYFTPENATLTPGVISLMKDLMDKLDYDISETKNEFIEVNKPIYQGSPTPISPKKAWPSLKEKLSAT